MQSRLNMGHAQLRYILTEVLLFVIQPQHQANGSSSNTLTEISHSEHFYIWKMIRLTELHSIDRDGRNE